MNEKNADMSQLKTKIGPGPGQKGWNDRFLMAPQPWVNRLLMVVNREWDGGVGRGDMHRCVHRQRMPQATAEQVYNR